jgi:hypothetical protein
MEKEKEKIIVIHVFDNQDDVINEIRSCEDHETPISLGEIDFLMNVADLVCNFMLLYGAGEISKDELDLCLGKKEYLTDANPLEFNFIFRSSINNLFYTNRHYYIDEKDLDDAYSTIIESYSELSIMYSFDRIIEQMQKMVADFKAAHDDFDKMTREERLDRFWSWQGNEDYLKNDFFEKHLDKCRTIYTILNHEHRSKKGGH